jgi:hypothetical protein
MAFDTKGLQILGGFGNTGSGSGGEKIFREARYITNDNAAAVEGSGYFNSAVKRLPKNTVIMAVLEASSTPKVKIYVVTSNNGAAVAIAEQTVTHPE